MAAFSIKYVEWVRDPEKRNMVGPAFQVFAKAETRSFQSIQILVNPSDIDSKKGELTDFSLIEPEREAIRNLFAGAIGAYKNPQSHRNVPTTAEDAVELIMLANRLLRIVDTSTKNP